MMHFKWRHFQKNLILMAVRWYVAYPLSYRDIEELMCERGLQVDHSTLHRWVIHYAPLLENEFRKKYKREVGNSWRMDETYIKIKGVWHYFSGQTHLNNSLNKCGSKIIIKGRHLTLSLGTCLY